MIYKNINVQDLNTSVQQLHGQNTRLQQISEAKQREYATWKQRKDEDERQRKDNEARRKQEEDEVRKQRERELEGGFSLQYLHYMTMFTLTRDLYLFMPVWHMYSVHVHTVRPQILGCNISNT